MRFGKFEIDGYIIFVITVVIFMTTIFVKIIDLSIEEERTKQIKLEQNIIEEKE